MSIGRRIGRQVPAQIGKFHGSEQVRRIAHSTYLIDPCTKGGMDGKLGAVAELAEGCWSLGNCVVGAIGPGTLAAGCFGRKGFSPDNRSPIRASNGLFGAGFCSVGTDGMGAARFLLVSTGTYCMLPGPDVGNWAYAAEATRDKQAAPQTKFITCFMILLFSPADPADRAQSFVLQLEEPVF